MKKYCITMERTVRIAKWFKAEDDDAAVEKAKEIHAETTDDEYECASAEHDYALDTEDGCNIVPWSN